MSDYTKLHTLVTKFRVGSPNIAPAVVFPTVEQDQWSAGIQFSYNTSVVIPIDYEFVFKEAAALR